MTRVIGVDGRFANAAQRAGVGNYSLGLIQALAKQLPEDLHLRVYLDSPPRPHLQCSGPRVEIRDLGPGKLWTQRALARELRRAPPQVYVAPTTNLPLRLPCPALVTVHDLAFLDFPEEFTWRRRTQARLQTRSAIRRAARLLADSRATAASIERHFPEAAARTTVVYPGVDPAFHPGMPEEACEAVRGRLALPRQYVLYVGRLQPRKNLVRLILAFAAARKAARTDHHLLLAGSPGWLYEATLAAAKRHADCVRLLGHVTEADLPPLIAGADCLALVSLWEGFGLPALEALACGTPVLASDVSALPEVVGDAGLLVDPHSESAIAQALQLLLEDESLRETLRQRGPAQAARFDWNHSAATLLSEAQTLFSPQAPI